ncbi:MAG: DapH/DapD/GlmU-related protein [Methanosarcina sp.]|uniref:acyltransferase n=1 Tax=Methanosarcina sp. TaxID=2213 RepID=UPI0026390F62|nr:DapH/DapD/GlmU-related protein [Methanosarcina sp.]MDD3245968.1 DapH/DapD/GlmU-related protein [Methanosarcina sp.]MDD4247602.1 DapH/DapD/GlmU-related protein [Methanosarcina sp.]
MVERKKIINHLLKGIDGIITPIILLMTKIIFIDSSDSIIFTIFGKMRGLILSPFIECASVPYIGKDVYFLELLTRKYVFGKSVCINNSCKFIGPLEIGDNVDMNHDVEVRSQTIIGNNVGIGPNTLFISDTHELGNEKERAGKAKYKKIIIEDGCWIGANVTILGGVTIGAGSVIAAGSVVATDIRPNTLVAGDRAKEIRELRKMSFLRR